MYPVSKSAAETGKRHGWSVETIYDAANSPEETGPARFEGQETHTRGNVSAVVDMRRKRVVTVFKKK